MIKSVLSNWMTLVISACLSIFITPFLVNKLGATQYGMWALTGDLIVYYGLLDMGMRAGLFRFAARFKGIDSRNDLDETFASAFSVAFGASMVLVLTIPVLVWLLPRFLKIDASLVGTFRLVVLFMGLAMAVTLSARMLSTYVASLSRFDLSNLCDSSTVILRTALIYTVLELRRGIVTVALMMLSASVFYLVLSYINVRRVDPRLSISLEKVKWSRIRELASFSAYASIGSLGDFLRFFTDSLVITRMLSVGLVTYFTLPGKLLTYMQAVIIGFGAPVNAELNSLDAQQKGDALRRLFVRSTRIAAVLTLFMCLIFAMNGKAILTLWIRQDMSLSYKVLLILLIGYMAELSQHPSVLVLLARSYQKPLGWLTLVEGVLNLGLSILWAKPFGILGVALGTAVPMILFRTLIFPFLAARSAGLSIWTYFHQGLARPFGAAVAAGALFIGVRLYAPGGITWGNLFFSVAWQSCALIAGFLFLGLTKEDRTYISLKLDSVFHRLSA